METTLEKLKRRRGLERSNEAAVAMIECDVIELLAMAAVGLCLCQTTLRMQKPSRSYR